MKSVTIKSSRLFVKGFCKVESRNAVIIKSSFHSSSSSMHKTTSYNPRVCRQRLLFFDEHKQNAFNNQHCTIQSTRHMSRQNVNTVLPEKEEKKDFVQAVFSNVAPNYDLMNDLMSIYIHRKWKDYFIHKMNPIANTKLIDVAGGTGDIAFRFLEQTKQNNDLKSTVTVCDINEEMIREGKQRALDKLNPINLERLSWIVGDALDLPFDDSSFDVYSIAYGIRNVPDIEQCLREAFRVLKAGGMFMCLEFSQVANPLFKEPYEKYLLEIVPVMGELVVGDYKSYRYLAESILNFPDQEEFKLMISDAGFKYVSYDNLMQGISAIHVGFKPEK